jgi:hypothetical protein
MRGGLPSKHLEREIDGRFWKCGSSSDEAAFLGGLADDGEGRAFAVRRAR